MNQTKVARPRNKAKTPCLEERINLKMRELSAALYANQLPCTPEIAIQRNAGRWCIVAGSHKTPTKFLDTAESRNVVNFIVSNAQGPVRVMVL